MLVVRCTDSLGNAQEINVEAKLVSDISDFVPTSVVKKVEEKYGNLKKI